MIVPKSFDSPCDMCDALGPHTFGAACIARGATGRWCEVMWICERCAMKQGQMTSRTEAAEYILSLAGPDYPDFDYPAHCADKE